ncbi:MAG: class I SAM-dependent methyltransferase [Brevefilum sp.]|nr:class I SAM-dependent methyltransferase [Brevefilum sp.]
MSSLGWLDVCEIDFNALLLLEPLHVRCIAEREPDPKMGTALKAHPAVAWYLRQTYPPIAGYIEKCLSLGKDNPSQEYLRAAELAVLDSMHDWLIYVLDPAKYDELAFLGWDDRSLLEMADFEDKIVLDIGSGTGRLAFTVAPLARTVYAVEPVANLRRYLYEKREQLGAENLYPLDGSITQIPLADDFADILMAGHVFGDDFEAEYAEMTRVVRNGGMILLHPGTNAKGDDPAHNFLIEKGFDFDIFEEPVDGLKRKYWKTIHK